MKWTTEQREVSGLKTWEENPRTIDEKSFQEIESSMEQDGDWGILVVDVDGTVVSGNQRLKALQKRGGVVDVKVPDRKLTDKERRRIALRANRTKGKDNWDILANWDKEDLLAGWFNEKDIDRLIDVQEDDFDADAALASITEPVAKLGDIWALGDHRVLCGDSTQPGAYLALLGDIKADMVFTDPPYNVDYKGMGKNTSERILNDNMEDEAFLSFLSDSFRHIKNHVNEDAGCYVFHSHKSASIFEQALKSNGFTIGTQLIWNKPSAGLGMGDYRTKHEPFYYCYLSKEHVFYGDRTGTTVWRIPEDYQRSLDWFKRELERQEDGRGTVWTMKRAKTSEYVHTTQKPIELAVKAIYNSSRRGDSVLDTFLGSGSTLIACEQTGRVCYGVELDPKYVDVIVQRWEQFTGKKAQKIT